MSSTKTEDSMYNKINKTVYSNSSYFGMVEILEYIVFIIIVYKYNPFSIATKHQGITNILTLIVALVYVLLFYFLRINIELGKTEGEGETGFLIKVLASVAIFIGSVVLTKTIIGFIAKGNMVTLFRYLILGLVITTALAIGYLLFKPIIGMAKKSEKGSIMSFLFNLVMYFPCLAIAILDYFKDQYRITTKSVWLLLLVEAILLVLWIIIPLILSAYTTKNGIQLLKKPTYLNTEHTLGTFEELHGQNTDFDLDTPDNKQEKFNYHYSLSSWFYLNPQPPNTSPAYNKYTNILSYGGKPAIEFNGILNSLRVTVESEKNPGQSKKVVIYETKDILFQKWNNIVINYDRGTMDIFLNGKLVGSKPSISPYMTFESITIGSNNGLHGGISNVMYFKDNLSKNYIEMMYIALSRNQEPFL